MARLEPFQQKLEHWCAASIRALANEPSVCYRGHCLHLKDHPLPVLAPHLRLDLSADDYRQLRGVADGIALRLRFSDQTLHQRLSPKNSLQMWVFEVLEQLRVESLVPSRLPGAKVNLNRRFLHWTARLNTTEFTETHAGMLLFAVVMICWSRLSGEQIPGEFDGLIESTRAGLSDMIGSHLAALRRSRESQLDFAPEALAIAVIVEKMIRDEALGADDAGDNKKFERLIKTENVSLQWLDADSSTWEQDVNTAIDEGINFVDNADTYAVFTTAYDRETEATHLVRQVQLTALRKRLDERIKQQNVNVPRLAMYLKKLFSRPQQSGWSFAKEQGFMDASRLTRLMTSPNDRQLFREEREKPATDCAVTLLIDNSGSMLKHIENIAVLVETLSRALDLAGVTTEVLGFTTGDWNGGKAHKDWLARGQPKQPGRLNQVCHIIYKRFELSWRRSRLALAALLKSDLFRESVDGEALAWAACRLRKCRENRRILLVISDGSPVDTATLLVNKEGYLDRHLKQVARDIEASADISLCAVGVGLDLSTYYRHSLSIDFAGADDCKALDAKLLFEVADLLNGSHRW